MYLHIVASLKTLHEKLLKNSSKKKSTSYVFKTNCYLIDTSTWFVWSNICELLNKLYGLWTVCMNLWSLVGQIVWSVWTIVWSVNKLYELLISMNYLYEQIVWSVNCEEWIVVNCLGVNCQESSGMHACNLHVSMRANLSLVEFLFWILGGSKHPTKLFWVLRRILIMDSRFCGEN